MKNSVVLIKARELLSKPGIHTTGREMRDKNGEPCNLNKAAQFGISGALMKVCDELPFDPLRITNLLRYIYAVLKKANYNGSIHNFNDSFRLEDILQVLLLASQEAESNKD